MKSLDLGTLKVHVFGGYREIGGNQILLEAGGGSLLLDFGKAFARWGNHFTEFLTPRSSLGLRDLLFLGLLPPLPNLYRDGTDDTLFPSPMEKDLLKTYPDGEKVLALLLTHAHLDHSGAVAYLRKDLPVVATATTAAIAKAMQDVSQVGLEGETTYLNPRALDPNEGILTAKGKSYLRRPFRLFQGKLSQLSQASPAKTKTLEGYPWEQASDPLHVGSFRVNAFPVDHSIPGACAFAVDTPEGLVVYTGDLRRHGRWGQKTEDFLRVLEKREVFLLITEGTRLGRDSKTYTELDVRGALHLLLGEDPHAPVAVDFAPRNLERLLSSLEVGEDLGRRLVITAKDAYLLMALSEAEAMWASVLSRVKVLWEGKGRRAGWEETVWQSPQVHPVTLEEIAKAPEAYLLAFGFYEVNRLLDFRLMERRLGRPSRTGVYVFSNSYWADQEQILDLKVLLQWLQVLDFRIYPEALAHLPSDAGEVDNSFHTSGHAPEDVLQEVVHRLKPRYLLPVHTERPERWLELVGGEVQVLL
ncbi:MAG: MBL fold metallo-hydrolase [Candidatus Methanomethylicaceae archaeon]